MSDVVVKVTTTFDYVVPTEVAERFEGLVESLGEVPASLHQLYGLAGTEEVVAIERVEGAADVHPTLEGRLE